jgi:hypothetical protein
MEQQTSITSIPHVTAPDEYFGILYDPLLIFGAQRG